MWPVFAGVFGAAAFGFLALIVNQHLEKPEITSARNLAQKIHFHRSEAVVAAGKGAFTIGTITQPISAPATFNGVTVRQFIPAGRPYLATYVTGLSCATNAAHCGLAASLAEISNGTITLYLTSGTNLTSSHLIQENSTNPDTTEAPALPAEVAGSASSYTLVIYDRLKK